VLRAAGFSDAQVDDLMCSKAIHGPAAARETRSNVAAEATA
jgi:hypothetical protein